MKRLLVFAFIVSIYPVLGRGADQHQSFWSESARVFKATESGKYAPILSPDGEIRFSFNGKGFTFQDKQGKILAELQDSISTPELLEIGWSPDARDVFINASDGGASGTWNTHVFQRSGTALREIPAGKLIEQASTLRSDCQFKNVGAVAWVKGHRNLLVLEQIPDSSGCSNMGQVVGYVLDVVTLEVTEPLSAEQVRARFHSQLGSQGQAAVE
jgi:hypothetical protein